jgi:hypothetical protein
MLTAARSSGSSAPDVRRWGEKKKYAHYERFRAKSTVVVLDPAVSKVFPNAAAVNQALRVLAFVARARVTVPKRASRATKRPNKGMKLTKRG